METRSDESDEIEPARSLPAANTTAVTGQQAQERLDTALSRPRGTGRELGWSDEELTALVVQGYDISSDLIVGAVQTVDKDADRNRAAFLAKLPPGACSSTGTKCALGNRRWTGRQAAVCLRKYKEVVRVCTRVYELQKRIDGLHLTGGPSEVNLGRVSLALFNNVVTIGNRELMYKIASAPEFNVGRFECRAVRVLVKAHDSSRVWHCSCCPLNLPRQCRHCGYGRRRV
jgi:hypothetical protein